MGRKKTIAVDTILDAAEALVAEIGAHRLTLDLVAERAGISKGGLTYNFASKEALIRAMSERELARFNSEVAKHLAEPGEKGPFPQLSARIAVTRRENDLMISKAASMAASLLQSDGEQAHLRAVYRADLDSLEGSSDAARRARVAFFALEGMFLLRGLGFLDIPQAEWEESLDDIRDACLGRL